MTRLKMIEKIKENYDLKEFKESGELEINDIREVLEFKHNFDDIDYAFNELYDFYKNVSNAFEEILGTENLQVYSKEGKMLLAKW